MYFLIFARKHWHMGSSSIHNPSVLTILAANHLESYIYPANAPVTHSNQKTSSQIYPRGGRGHLTPRT